MRYEWGMFRTLSSKIELIIQLVGHKATIRGNVL